MIQERASAAALFCFSVSTIYLDLFFTQQRCPLLVNILSTVSSSTVTMWYSQSGPGQLWPHQGQTDKADGFPKFLSFYLQLWPSHSCIRERGGFSKWDTVRGRRGGSCWWSLIKHRRVINNSVCTNHERCLRGAHHSGQLWLKLWLKFWLKLWLWLWHFVRVSRL